MGCAGDSQSHEPSDLVSLARVDVGRQPRTSRQGLRRGVGYGYRLREPSDGHWPALAQFTEQCYAVPLFLRRERREAARQIGRASGRERGCQYGKISEVGVQLKQK